MPIRNRHRSISESPEQRAMKYCLGKKLFKIFMKSSYSAREKKRKQHS